MFTVYSDNIQHTTDNNSKNKTSFEGTHTFYILVFLYRISQPTRSERIISRFQE